MPRIFIIMTWVLTLSACWGRDDLATHADKMAFELAGTTIFHQPTMTSMKEIHLDNGVLTGREIVVEGQLLELSANSTFAVLTDDDARLLVVLTDLEDAGPALRRDNAKILRVMGTVETGKKGLPYLKARAINIMRGKEGAAQGKRA